MGSHLSRTIRPPATAETSALAPASHDTNHANTLQKPQEPVPQFSETSPRHNHSNSSDVFPAALPMALQRRHSAPAPTSATAVTPGAAETAQEPAATFSLFLEEYRLMSIQLPDGETGPPAVATGPPTIETDQRHNQHPNNAPYVASSCLWKRITSTALRSSTLA
ncbi:hypothetical protein ACJQWK_07838 [Exserohilum turcicum]